METNELLKKIAPELEAQNRLSALKLAKETSSYYLDTDFRKEEEYILELCKRAKYIL